jgi:hypothetical protein
MGRMIQWESLNELNAFRLLDADPSASAYSEQPLTVRFVLSGETHLHFPDVLVQRDHSRELWEIKPQSEAGKPTFVARTRLLESALPELGFAYRLIIAEDLAKQPRLSNTLMLLKYGREPVSELAREHIRQILLTIPEISWGAAINDDLCPKGQAVLSRLALEGFLSFDIDQKLTATTSFRLRASKESLI